MGPLTVRRRLASGLLAVALSALTACGDAAEQAQDPDAAASSSPEESSEPSGSESSDGPACEDVWAAGEQIARTYRGCVDESGAFVERDSVGCSSGQRMVVFDDRFWGVLGGTVYEADGSLDEDRDYRDATRRCAA